MDIKVLCNLSIILLQRQKAEELAKEEERERHLEEARQKEEEERDRQLREESEELWLQEQEQKFKELQEREREKQREKQDQNILLVDVGASDINNRPGSGLNNERARVPSGNLSYVPNDLRQGQRPKLEKNLSLDNTSVLPGIPDRELKRGLTISDSSYR